MTTMQITTTFSKHLVEANQWLATALEQDGSAMHESLQRANICAKIAEEMAYEHSVGEKIAAANLRNTIDTVKVVLTNG